MKTITLKLKTGKSISSQYSSQGILESHTNKPFMVTKVPTSEGDKWIPCRAMQSILHIGASLGVD